MKSFSVKALVLALVVVGSASANTKIDHKLSAKDSFITNILKVADVRIFGGYIAIDDPSSLTANKIKHEGFPVFRNLDIESPYTRAAIVAGAAAVATGVVVGAVVAVRAAYNKYVAKPAVEADNAEANVEAAQ